MTTEKDIQEIAETLNVRLPAGNVPTLDGMIALLTSIGGISILANVMTDVVQPGVPLDLYILHLVVGIIMTSIGYGILKRRGWAVWLYGIVCIIGLVINPILAIVPALVTGYLYSRGDYFDPILPLRLLKRVDIALRSEIARGSGFGSSAE